MLFGFHFKTQIDSHGVTDYFLNKTSIGCKWSFPVFLKEMEVNGFTVIWNAVLFLLNHKLPAYLAFNQKETDFELDSS